LLRVFGFTFFLILVVTFLFVLSVALLVVCSLTEFFILGLALRVVFSLAGGAVFRLALVLVLLHTHLFVVRLAVRCANIFPLNMAFGFLQLLLKMVSYLGKEPCASRHCKTCYI